jgi:hypothetical protein
VTRGSRCPPASGGRDGRRRLPDRWSIGRAAKRDGRARAATQRLRRGQLDGLVLDYIDSQDADAVGATAVAKALGRSAGAVGNCLTRLAAAGRVHQVSDKRGATAAPPPHRAARPFAKGDVMKVIGLGSPDDVRVRFDAGEMDVPTSRPDLRLAARRDFGRPCRMPRAGETSSSTRTPDHGTTGEHWCRRLAPASSAVAFHGKRPLTGSTSGIHRDRLFMSRECGSKPRASFSIDVCTGMPGLVRRDGYVTSRVDRAEHGA